MRQRGVVAVPDSGFTGVRWDHAVARVIIQQPCQEMMGFGLSVISVRPLSRELLLNCLKEVSIHDPRLLAGQDFTLVFDLTDIEPVTQQIEERSAFEQNAATAKTGREESFLCINVLFSEISHQRIDPAEFKIS